MKYGESILSYIDMQIVNCRANSFKFVLFLNTPSVSSKEDNALRAKGNTCGNTR